MKIDRPTQYRIFLLTFWVAEDDDLEKPESWRFRIEEPKSKSRWGCVGLGNLLLQLVRKMGDQEQGVDDAVIDDAVVNDPMVNDTGPDNPASATSPDG